METSRNVINVSLTRGSRWMILNFLPRLTDSLYQPQLFLHVWKW